MGMLTPFPVMSEIAQSDRTVGNVWSRWFTALRNMVNGTPVTVGSVALTAQSAAITTAAIPVQPSSLTKGLYRLTYYLRKTVVGSSSSTTVTLGWTDGTIACTKAFAALTTNTTGATDSNTYTVQADANSNLTYAVAYASTGTPLQFAFQIGVEALP